MADGEANGDHKNGEYPGIPADLELRNITTNPKPGPTIDLVLIAGIDQPGAPQICKRFAQDFNLYYIDLPSYLMDLCDTSAHDREAYCHLHPSAFRDRFCRQLDQTSFVQSSASTFFLLPILRWKIDREVKNGWTGFVLSGLEISLRVTREFTLKIAQPAAVICFRSAGAGLGSRATIEQLFPEDELVGVPVGASLQATYGTLLAETIGKHGMPTSPPYSPSP